jgi:4-hydroxybenzoate polyprenyltransferase
VRPKIGRAFMTTFFLGALIALILAQHIFSYTPYCFIPVFLIIIAAAWYQALKNPN